MRPRVSPLIGWRTFESEAASAGATHTVKWIASKRRVMKRQFATYQEGRPRSGGSLETTLKTLKDRIGDRRYVVRNRPRLELILALMALDLREEADERSFVRVLRRLLEQNAGTLVLPRRSLDDKGGSSLHAAILEVERRLAPKRAQNRQNSPAARARSIAVAAVETVSPDPEISEARDRPDGRARSVRRPNDARRLFACSRVTIAWRLNAPSEQRLTKGAKGADPAQLADRGLLAPGLVRDCGRRTSLDRDDRRVMEAPDDGLGQVHRRHRYRGCRGCRGGRAVA